MTSPAIQFDKVVHRRRFRQCTVLPPRTRIHLAAWRTLAEHVRQERGIHPRLHLHNLTTAVALHMAYRECSSIFTALKNNFYIVIAVNYRCNQCHLVTYIWCGWTMNKQHTWTADVHLLPTLQKVNFYDLIEVFKASVSYFIRIDDIHPSFGWQQ